MKFWLSMGIENIQQSPLAVAPVDAVFFSGGHGVQMVESTVSVNVP